MIKENFDRYIGAGETDVFNIDFYYPGFMNLVRCVLRFKSKIIINGHYDDSDYIDEPYDPYDPVGF